MFEHLVVLVREWQGENIGWKFAVKWSQTLLAFDHVQTLMGRLEVRERPYSRGKEVGGEGRESLQRTKPRPTEGDYPGTLIFSSNCRMNSTKKELFNCMDNIYLFTYCFQ